MTYGLECWDANNDLVLDTNERYSRIIYSNTVSSDGSVTLSALEGHDSIQFGVYLGDVNRFDPQVTRDLTDISWNLPVSDTALIIVMIYT